MPAAALTWNTLYAAASYGQYLHTVHSQTRSHAQNQYICICGCSYVCTHMYSCVHPDSALAIADADTMSGPAWPLLHFGVCVVRGVRVSVCVSVCVRVMLFYNRLRL